MKVRVLKPEHLDKKLKLKAGDTTAVDNPEYLAALIVAGAVEDAAEPSSLEQTEPKVTSDRPKKRPSRAKTERAPQPETAVE